MSCILNTLTLHCKNKDSKYNFKNMQLIPPEYLKNSIESYLVKYTTNLQKIYWVVLFALVIALVTLPFIYVDIYIQEQGVIRPLVEKTEIKANITELIDSVYVKEGQTINQGDTILTFRRSTPNYKIQYQQKRVNDFQEHLKDLHFLVKGERPIVFNSEMRRQEYLLYIQRRREYENGVFKAKKDLDRNKPLFEKQVISEEECEQYQYEYNKVVNELASLMDNQINQWQQDLNSYSNLYEEMRTLLNQEIKNKDLYVVISPIGGTLDQFNGIYAGSSVQTGNTLAVISPDSTLFAEIYISPHNIGYIYPGMSVKIQVSSFSYNEWGTVNGKVTEISSDFLTDQSGKNTFFKVKCCIEKDYLVRKNGAKGKLKKGMTVLSHFVISERSLFDLLYQKFDDWVNPIQYASNQLIENEKNN